MILVCLLCYPAQLYTINENILATSKKMYYVCCDIIFIPKLKKEQNEGVTSKRHYSIYSNGCTYCLTTKSRKRCNLF